jgi:AcrR family transcriptional regulator
MALYWHVANKDELLAATTDDVVERALAGVAKGAPPREAIRALAVGVFDAIRAHPWVGAQLSREPWQPAIMLVFEGIGGKIQALGVPERALFDSATAIVHYILGLAGQYAAGARLVPRDATRTEYLGAIAAQWMRLDSGKYPFLHHVAGQLADHDDREQFLAGIDLILTGILAGR